MRNGQDHRLGIRYAADPPARYWATTKADPKCLLEEQERREPCGENSSENRRGQSKPVQQCSYLGKGLREGAESWPDCHRFLSLAAWDSTAIARTGHLICWVSNSWTVTGAGIRASEHSDSSVFVFWTWYWIWLRHWPHTSCIAQMQKRAGLHLVELHRAEGTLTPFNV